MNWIAYYILSSKTCFHLMIGNACEHSIGTLQSLSSYDIFSNIGFNIKEMRVDNSLSTCC